MTTIPQNVGGEFTRADPETELKLFLWEVNPGNSRLGGGSEVEKGRGEM